MPVPKPPNSLDGSCSVIHDNTLYSFSAAGFLSIKLEENAKWKTLKSGVKVTGATCASKTVGDAALFVVGGRAESDDYPGLQKYTFSTDTWENITPTDLVTKNRQWHGSIYLPSTDMIVVYAGNQNGDKGPTTDSFSIKASEPFDVHSHGSSAPPPGLSPTLFRWTGSDVGLLGGDTTSLWWFNDATGWRKSPTTLAEPIPDTPSVKPLVADGSDGSKSLYVFDMAKTPNQVSRFVVRDASGKDVLVSSPVSAGRNARKRDLETKRDLTLDNWPKYNDTLAPKTARTDYTMAEGPDGMVVFSGGNDESALSIFDANRNRWVNAAKLFSPDDFSIKDTKTSTTSSQTKTQTTTTSSLTSSTSTFATSTISSTTSASATATTSAAALPPSAQPPSKSDDGLSSNAILGITLGTILGFLAILALILLCLRRRKRRQNVENGKPTGPNGTSPAEKDIGGGAPSGFSPPSPGHFRGHHPTLSQESYSSMAILMGRMGGQKSSLTRKPSNDSDRSSTSSLHKQFKSTISKPIQQPPAVHPALQAATGDDKAVAFAAPAPEPRRRNGPSDAQDGLRRSSGWNRYWSGGSALNILGFGASKRNTAVSEQSSRYSQGTNTVNPRVTQDSATVPPLNFEGRPEVNSVISGSPVVSQHTNKVPLKEGMAGTIERPVSAASSGYSSGIPESVHEFWDPMSASKPWGSERAPSSAYSGTVPQGTQLAPSPAAAKTLSGHTGVSTQPQLSMAATSSDMSWLNLGGDKSRP